MRPNSVKRALKAGQPSVGTWLSLGSITAARFMARAGFSWLTVDIEHSLVDWETATHMLPNDLAASMRSKDGKPPSGQAIKDVAPGIHCYSAEEVNARMAEGWQFMAITSELKMMLNGAAMELKKITGGLAPAGEMARY